MTSLLIEAVTFDFWNTLMWEEPGSLKKKRMEVWGELLRGRGVPVDELQLDRAHDRAHEEYVASWKEGRQFRVGEAVEHMVRDLAGRGGDVEEALIEGFHEGGRRAAVQPSDGVYECLEALKGADVRVGIICDIGLTPSSVVRELLARHELDAFFDAMSFSDEVGHYKPSRAIFEHALTALGGIPPERAGHVGDRRRTDVGGAIGMGMVSVRYDGVFDDDGARIPEAAIVVSDMASLPALLGIHGSV